MIFENNQVAISGEIAEEFQFNHEAYGEKFYCCKLNVLRMSDTMDIIPLMVSERLADMKEQWVGHKVKITGSFRSYNNHTEEKSRLILYVFAEEFEELLMDDLQSNNLNNIKISGFVCKPPIYRKTPLGREIADLLIAVNRPYGKSDYMPCIAWGRNARYVSDAEVGEKLYIEGRIQSREYDKKIDDGTVEKRVAYEVSTSKVEKVEG